MHEVQLTLKSSGDLLTYFTGQSHSKCFGHPKAFELDWSKGNIRYLPIRPHLTAVILEITPLFPILFREIIRPQPNSYALIFQGLSVGISFGELLPCSENPFPTLPVQESRMAELQTGQKIQKLFVFIEKESSDASDSFVPPLPPNSSDKTTDPIVMPLPENPTMDLLRYIFKESLKYDNNTLLINKLNHYIAAISYDMLHQLKQYFEHCIKQKLDAASEKLQRLLAAKEELLRDFSQEHLQINLLSKKAGMNRNKFQQEFREHFGSSVFQYYQDARFNKALYLITHENSTTQHAASAVGYRNVSFFIKEFKKKFGYTPNDYPKKIA